MAEIGKLASYYMGDRHADNDEDDRRRRGTGSDPAPKSESLFPLQQEIADFRDPNFVSQTAHAKVFSPDNFLVSATSDVTKSAAAASSLSPFRFVDPTLDFSARRWRDAA